jgi:hypothetical protein
MHLASIPRLSASIRVVFNQLSQVRVRRVTEPQACTSPRAAVRYVRRCRRAKLAQTKAIPGTHLRGSSWYCILNPKKAGFGSIRGRR